jgi:hypothetical protein
VSIITTLVGSKIAAGVMAGVVVVGGGGAGAAAYANVLPTPIQEAAHDLIGAPAPEATATETETADAVSDDTDTDESDSDESSTSSSSVGPDMTGPAAYGLCNAFSHDGLGVNSTP